MVQRSFKYVLVKLMNNKFHDLTKIDKEKQINFITARRIKDNNRRTLELKNIELQKRIYDMKWTIDTCINLLKEGNSEKALKLLKKVVYEK